MKYYLTLIAIFKNESAILREWLDHYLMEGVEHFYLIDNNSIDEYQSILKPYIDEGVAECVCDPRPHMQVVHYNSYYNKRVKEESEWVMVVDLDEFIYSRLAFGTISDYLKSVSKDVSQVYVPWKLFGSSGLIEQPCACIDSFCRRTLYNHTKTNGMCNADRILAKTVVRTQYLSELGIHSAKVSGGQQITSDGQTFIVKDPHFQTISEAVLLKSALHNNHYPIQSYDWFRRIKMTRGSAAGVSNDKLRTNDYYNSFDIHSNVLEDKELADKRGRFKVYYGVGTYRDVTRQFNRHFVDKVKKTFTVDKSLDFNNYFGDPVPGQVKSLIIRQDNHLRIYPEQHDTIQGTTC